MKCFSDERYGPCTSRCLSVNTVINICIDILRYCKIQNGSNFHPLYSRTFRSLNDKKHHVKTCTRLFFINQLQSHKVLKYSETLYRQRKIRNHSYEDKVKKNISMHSDNSIKVILQYCVRYMH